MNTEIKQLLDMGISRWAIAKYVYFNNQPTSLAEMHKKYNNVAAWAKGWWSPNVEHKKALQKMLTQEVRKRRVFEKPVEIRAAG